MSAQNITTYMPWLTSVDWFKMFTAVAIFIIGFFAAQLIKRVLYKVFVRFLPEPTSRNISRFVYYVLLLLVLASVMGALGIDLTGFLVAGGIIGIILGFALQSLVANLFSGLFLYWEKPFNPGDLVEINDLQGRVLDITIMSTKILGLDGVKIRLPNQEVFKAYIKNYEASKARRIDFIIGIAYKEDAEKAYNVIKKVIDEHPLVLIDPPPDIYVYELGNSSVNILVRVWVPSKKMIWYEVSKDLLWKMKKAITEAGIEIPFIQNDVWFRTPLRIELVGRDAGQRQTRE